MNPKQCTAFTEAMTIITTTTIKNSPPSLRRRHSPMILLQNRFRLPPFRISNPNGRSKRMTSRSTTTHSLKTLSTSIKHSTKTRTSFLLFNSISKTSHIDRTLNRNRSRAATITQFINIIIIIIKVSNNTTITSWCFFFALGDISIVHFYWWVR